MVSVFGIKRVILESLGLKRLADSMIIAKIYKDTVWKTSTRNYEMRKVA